VPIATIHVLEGRYDERRIGHVSRAVQDALISVLKIPAKNYSLGQGLAQRAFISAGTVGDGDVPITPASVDGEL
jgi:hypothetical protein